MAAGTSFSFVLPFLGKMTFSELALPAIILGGAIDSVNPCAFGVLIFLMTYLTKVFDERRTALLGGLLYTSAVYITYLLSGIGLLGALRDTSPFVFWGLAGGAVLLGYIALQKYRTAGYWFFGVAGFIGILALLATVPRTTASYAF
ncbi:MAG: hypothetical protein SVU32_03885, partial [Candidatus Nanohaloarchaea archaeon]|nr:hypothetical protein [Candidatus Nanohaloarchaea archaeon]